MFSLKKLLPDKFIYFRVTFSFYLCRKQFCYFPKINKTLGGWKSGLSIEWLCFELGYNTTLRELF
jgi:hypothetical protein